jgi:hypothetical protein
MSRPEHDPSRVNAPTPDSAIDQKPETASMIAGLVVGLTFVLVFLFAGWHFLRVRLGKSAQMLTNATEGE